MNKKNLIIIGSVFTLVIVVVIIYIMNKEKNTLKSSLSSTNEMDALINNYDAIVDYETQVAVWKHVFKTCPYWKAMVRDQFEMHGAGEGGNLESRYIIEADHCILKGRQPADYLKKCNDKYEAISTDYNKKKCEDKSKRDSLIGLLTGALWMRKKTNC